MLFKFKDGATKEMKFGLKLGGLKANGRRPVGVTVSVAEIQNTERLGQYLHLLALCIDRDGEGVTIVL